MSNWRTLIAAWLITTTPSTVTAKEPSAVFAAHDPENRLPNTTIERLGELKVDKASFAIFYLTFVNPVSRQGQHRIAIIRNETRFAGSYQCWLREGGAKLTIGKDRLIVQEGGQQFVVKFDRNGPKEKAKFYCGEGSGWEDSI